MKAQDGYFKKNKLVFIVGGVAIALIAICTVVAVVLIRNHQADEQAKQAEQAKLADEALLSKFKNIYLMTAGDYTDEQGECVWNQISSLVNESDILAAAKEYDANGVISGKNTFANKVYSSIDSIHKKCNVATENATKNIDKITDVIDITLSGNGVSSSETFALKRGLVDLNITGSYIGIELKSVKGDYVDCYGSFGDYSETETKTYLKKCTLDRAGDYFLDIHGAPGKWSVNIRQE